MIDRKYLFDGVKAKVNGWTPQQINGLDAILDEADARNTPFQNLAYMIATTIREVGGSFQPIKEYGGPAYYTRMYDINGQRPDKARELGNLTPGDGAKYCGRGLVQLTGKINYDKAGRLTGLDLVGNPDLAMQTKPAVLIMFDGMESGMFTGKKLSDYFGNGKDDPLNARKIINGLDHAQEIADTYRVVLSKLRNP